MQEYWSGLLCSPLGDLPDPETEPTSLTPALAGGFFTTSATWKAHLLIQVKSKEKKRTLNMYSLHFLIYGIAVLATVIKLYLTSLVPFFLDAISKGVFLFTLRF